MIKSNNNITDFTDFYASHDPMVVQIIPHYVCIFR